MKITERGWAGHYVCSHHCLFRRNTLIEHEKTRIVVSTVGAMLIENKIEKIGLDHYYETMAFYAKKNDQWNDADVRNQAKIESKSTIKDYTRTRADIEANQMHEDIVQEIIKRIKNGDLK